MKQKYADPIIGKYIDLIKNKNGEIKTFFQGEPTRVAVSMLPACIISKLETRVGVLTNAEDQHEVALRITIITDIRKDLSTDENDATMVEGISKLYEIVEGRDDQTFELKDTSILDILRGNQLVDQAHNLRTDLNTITRINYGETLRGRNPEQWTTEAQVEFVAQFSQVR